MAARRVVLLLLGVLAISTLVAALVPTPPERSPAPDRGKKKGTERRDSRTRSPRRGQLVVATFGAAGRRSETIRLRKGDELRMEVGSPVAEQIEIPAFGLIEDASPDAPARFDLLTYRRGTFEIRLVGSGRTVGRLVVR